MADLGQNDDLTGTDVAADDGADGAVRDLIGRVAARAAAAHNLTPESVRDATSSDRGRTIRPIRLPVRLPRPWVVATSTVAAAVLLLAVLIPVLTTGSPPAGQTSSPTSPMTMELVDSTTSPFESVGGGPQTGNLVCVTASVCYAGDDSDGQTGVERTSDGGATWKPTAALPNSASVTWPLSCPTTEVCVGAAGYAGTNPVNLANATTLPLAITTDGGDHWRIDVLSVPAGISQASVDQVACATALDCVVHVYGSQTGAAPSTPNGSPPVAGTFVATTDGGASWTTSTTPMTVTSQPLFTLHCDPGGDCIGLVPQGSAQDPTSQALETIRSSDGGLTWTSSVTSMVLGMGILLMSCGDAQHCVAAFPADSGRAMGVAVTANAGATWQVMQAPASWPTLAVDVSCATGLDCWISGSDYNSTETYNHPEIEATHDGGATWSPLSLPTVDGAPLSLVYPLSCPVPSGCIGVGATPQQFNPTTPPPPGGAPVNGSRVIVSNLDSASTS